MQAWSRPVGPSDAWSASYARYVAASGERSARTAEVTRQVLRRIARGELSPTLLESAHSAYLTPGLSHSADRLADATTQFLTGLVEAGNRYSWELVDSVVPGAVPAPEDDVAPRFERGDWSTWFERLTRYTAERNAELTAMLRTVMERVASGELSPADAHTASEEFHRERLPSAVDRVVELFVTLLDRLDEANADYTTRFLESVLGLARPREPVGDTLDLVAPLGTTARGRFAVAHEGSEPSSVRSVLGDVRRSDGVGPAFEVDATVAPDGFVLAAGTEEVLTVTVALSADRFEVGPEYEGTLSVLSPTTTLVELPLRMRAVHPPEPPADEDGEA